MMQSISQLITLCPSQPDGSIRILTQNKNLFVLLEIWQKEDWIKISKAHQQNACKGWKAPDKKKSTHIFTSAYIFDAHILAIIAASPIIYIGTDYEDFSIFHLTVQKISATQPVNWFTYHHTFLQNPIAGICLVLDIPVTNFIHAQLIRAVSNYTHQERLALYVLPP